MAKVFVISVPFEFAAVHTHSTLKFHIFMYSYKAHDFLELNYTLQIVLQSCLNFLFIIECGAEHNSQL